MSMETHNWEWTHTTEHGHTQMSMDTHNWAWTHTTERGYTQLSMDTHNWVWTRTNERGHTQMSIDTHKWAWTHTTENGHTQTSTVYPNLKKKLVFPLHVLRTIVYLVKACVSLQSIHFQFAKNILVRGNGKDFEYGP